MKLTNRNGLISLIAAGFAVFAALCGLCSCASSSPSYSRVLDANWGFALPSEAAFAQVYAADSGASFHGDGLRCHVFSYKNEEPVAAMLAWSAEERATVYYDSYSEAAAAWLDELAVPPEMRPAARECSFWYARQEDNSEIVVFWNKGEKRLYVVESFI